MNRLRLAVCLVALALGGCAQAIKETVTVPVFVEPQHLPVPHECRARSRVRFPELPRPAPLPDGTEGVLPEDDLELRWLDAHAAADANDNLTLFCECYIVAEVGTDADKAEASPRCSKLKRLPQSHSSPTS